MIVGKVTYLIQMSCASTVFSKFAPRLRKCQIGALSSVDIITPDEHDSRPFVLGSRFLPIQQQCLDQYRAVLGSKSNESQDQPDWKNGTCVPRTVHFSAGSG
jgi:hypothetical protein